MEDKYLINIKAINKLLLYEFTKVKIESKNEFVAQQYIVILMLIVNSRICLYWRNTVCFIYSPNKTPKKYKNMALIYLIPVNI